MQAAALSRDLDWEGIATVCDVGGGTGIVLERLLRDHLDLEGILFDDPEVLTNARDALRTGDLARRCRLVPGDYLVEVPANADRYLLVAIMTECSDARALALLRTIGAAVRPGATVMLVDNVLSSRPTDEMAQATDLLLLALGVGRERTRAELLALFAEAGFDVVAAHRLSTGSTAFELTRPS